MSKKEFKMKKHYFLVMIPVAVMVLSSAGCGTTKVTRMGPEKIVDISGRWNDTDARF
jgi:hypothetical protein